ncbi:MAG: PQQ-binding-like beta-propeller repeat protein [Verrucomicrobiota bacterium]
MKPSQPPTRAVRLSLALALVWSASNVFHATAAAPQGVAKQVFEATGVKGGIVVHLGCGEGQVTATLRPSDSYQVQGWDKDAAKIARGRMALSQKGVYGPIAVDVLEGTTLPYVDNLINLVVAEDLQGVPMNEVMRVLVPNGVAYVKQGGQWQKTVKSRPSALDDWTHYYYDAKGNTTSKDTVVGPPERLQWVGSPRWSRHHDRMSSLSAQVSSNGRLFYIMDEGSRISILLPSKWMLIARDAFNGTILWKRPIPKWQDHMWPLKTGPTQLTRRLVADGDRIYVTPELEGPVICVDGATGETIRTYNETKGTEEILHVNGTLYLLVNPDKWALTDYAPRLQQDQQRVANEYGWDRKPRQLMAVNAATGKVLWKREATVAPITLAVDGKRASYYDGEKVVCIDTATGKQNWATTPTGIRKLIEYNFAPRVLFYDRVILYAGGDGVEKGFDAATGKELWSGSHEKSGYRSPEDLIVAGGLVWNAGTTSGNQSGEFTGRDPFTGEVKKKFSPDVPDGTYWFHHRCYIAKATEKFIIASRTGIEFVDHAKEHWDLNHWVRGACLYGVMPANGLTYAGPHNCACYPEAKLDGLNAMASGAGSPHPKPRPDEQRLEKGPAYNQPLAETEADAKDWPTYRHDAARSGFSGQPLATDLGAAWQVDIPGPLSALTIAAGKVYVAQVDAHTVHALDAVTGKPAWRYVAGARVDSPPTYWKGRVLFGCKDGNVYCVRATDGALIWRYRAAPSDRRHCAWEQVESVWPVHGSVLVENGTVNFVAGRSVFLDGGLRFIRLEAATGKKLAEMVYNDRDPETGKDFQERHKTLQMPVGLNDILSSNGKHIYLRSQKIAADGKRIDIGPISANAAQQGGAQQGEGAHLFAPMGFLDDSWFHRSYWIYGKNFAGGHNGYYQAGKYTPEGRILVHDDKNVYGFSRLPQYYKWTTTMEHQLFSASKEAPKVAIVDPPGGKQKQKAKGKANPAPAPVATGVPTVRFADVDKADPANKALTVEAWILPDGKDGVIMAHGGALYGYALGLQDGRPGFSVRNDRQLATAEAQRPLSEGWHHVAGVLTEGKMLRVYVDGELAAETKAPALIAKKPNQGLQIGAPGASVVSDFGKGAAYTGLIDQFAIFHRALAPAEIVEHAVQANGVKRGNGAVLAMSFDNGNARDESGNNIDGALSGVDTGKGKVGAALWFRKQSGAPVIATPAGAPAGPARGSFVEHNWNRTVPIFTRAMAMAGNLIFVSGPPDNIDEEYAFERMTQKDQGILKELAEQDAALDGKRGAIMWAVSTDGGKMATEFKMDSPPVWDGMAVAQGRLYVSSVDGKVTCYGRK